MRIDFLMSDNLANKGKDVQYCLDFIAFYLDSQKIKIKD